jgi:(1->4)-alpha-D-glucan 1-alpha-D-glucosylmutase
VAGGRSASRGHRESLPSWRDPDPDYEGALREFVGSVVTDPAFREEVDKFLLRHRVVELGRMNSLAQTCLLLTCPGVPDIYQGSELWDLSLTDPDNRRPVDYVTRTALMEDMAATVPKLSLRHDDVGAWKLWIIRSLLAYRRSEPAVFESDRYEPLEVDAPWCDHSLAFRRGDLAVVVPRLLIGLDSGRHDATVAIGSGPWTNLITGRSIAESRPGVSELLADAPVAVLRRRT